MREKNHNYNRTKTILLTILLLCTLLSLKTSIINAKNSEMKIEINEEMEQIKIYENKNFSVSVYRNLSSNTSYSPYLTDVKINFTGKTKNITKENSGVVSYWAPEVSEDTNYTITANKTGYNTTSKNITILNKQELEVILPEGNTIDADKNLFTVVVKTKAEMPVANATVTIQGFGTSSDTKKTDEKGLAWLSPPKNREEITIIAKKTGYKQGSAKAKINLPAPWWESIPQHPLFPVFIAATILAFAVVYVNIRKRKDVDRKKTKVKEEKETTTNSSGKVFPSKKEGQSSKVEEIRISKPSNKDREVVSMDTEEKRKVMPVRSKKEQNSERNWFEGKEEARHQIDKLTKDVDEEDIDEWFEGIEDVKKKVDEKVKKKNKEKED